ncbi:hypothetical protein BCD64_07700 [Nostoc sp. MBR 210]|uniref:Lipoprotein n=1 Tax=Nostoc spongiaeforme FACHB-130 TaxID=1357510 RepID=A0ABR8FPM5_9NOSO|nr:hypothetical protein [Nostoc spongiaeforme]MBD2593419.1 hypothetical protein [Nostoc spongiaeforme FACHB-130]OCQ92632.1 hypothetical protein BCD64_07700 [Nostoc sp. MBR 210]
MSVWRKYSFITSVSLSLALLVAGCENKTSQCQRLIQVVNEGNALIDQNKGKQAITSLQLSKDLEAINTSLEELKLADPKLKEYQSRFQKVFDNLSNGIAKAAKALAAAKTAEASPTGREKIKKARTDIDTALSAVAKTAGKESDTLMNDLNKYCSQSE